MTADGPSAAARWGWRGAALIVGGLPALAFPAPALWWLAYVALVPTLLIVIRGAGLGDAAWRTWLAAAGFFIALHHWLVPSLGPFTLPVALLLATSWLPIGLATWWLLGGSRGGRHPIAAMVVVPSVWVAVEFLRSWEMLGGSWGLLGATQWQVLPVVALAAVAGIWAMSLLLVVCNVAVTIALAPRMPTRARLGALGGAAVVVVATVTSGALRPDAPVERTVVVAGVQPGLIHDAAERLRANEELTATLDGERLDLVVWGQSSVGFDPQRRPEVAERLRAAADEVGVPVLVNTDARRASGRITKTATLVRPGIGLSDTYQKQRLVPFGEYIPLRPLFGWVERFTEAADEDRVPGAEEALMRVDDLVFGPLISYESTFPDLRRAVARLGAEMTVVQGASTTFQGSWAQPQQASYEAVRAVESGRPALLVAVSGTSAAFDARGRRLAWMPADETGAFVVEVPLSQEATPYVRFGDWLPLLCMVVSVGAAAVGAHGWWRRRQSGADSSSS